MSSDLFAAFGGPEEPPKQTPSAPAISPGVRPGELNSTHQEPEEDDFGSDFGDFEDASTPMEAPKPQAPQPQRTKPPQPPAKELPAKKEPVKTKPLPFSPKPKEIAGDGRHPFAAHMDLLFDADDDEYNAGEDEMTDLANNPEAAMEYSKRIIEAQQKEEERRKETQAQNTSYPTNSQRAPEPAKSAPKKDPNVLFDADNVSEHDDDEDEDDDFGDFEAEGGAWDTPEKPQAKMKQSPPKSMPALDLLGLDDSPSAWDTEKPKNPPKFSPKAPTPAKTPAPRATRSTNDEDPWDDFDDTTPSSPPKPKSTTHPLPPSNPPLPKPTTSTDSLPPTNIPPPALLLSIFPSLTAAAHESLFGPLSKLEMKQRQMLLSHPATHQFLTGYLRLAHVLAHLIAGRKYRWKRDTRLAQSMRIGAAGSKGGMKLTGLDKSETAKEDREAEDAVRAWRAQVGKLRAAVAGASTVPGAARLPAVPEIAEVMPVKVLKANEGGFVAPAACALCGLKREERVARVDEGVEDSFGEWWVERTGMHTGCRDFWEEHQGRLRSR